MHLFYNPELDSSKPVVSGDEAHHALRVLRLNSGNKVRGTNGKGLLITGSFTPIDKNSFGIEDNQITEIARPFHRELGIGILHHSDRMEWLVEKATEIGITKLFFISMQRSERNKINVERLRKIAVSAMKQSGQAWLPQIEGPIELELWLKRVTSNSRLVCHMSAPSDNHIAKMITSTDSTAVLIGPEGDFSESELQHVLSAGFIPTQLGFHTLRAETAALAALVWINSPDKG